MAGFLLHKAGVGQTRLAEAGVGLAVTIVLASLSYRFYEKPFLKLKKRVAWVESAPA